MAANSRLPGRACAGLLLAVLGLLAVACGGETASNAPDAVSHDTYAALVRQQADQIGATVAQQNDTVAAVSETANLDAVLAAAAAAAPAVEAARTQAINALSPLVPPADVANDHTRFLGALRNRQTLFVQLRAVAESGNATAFTRIGREIDLDAAALRDDLSPEYRSWTEGFLTGTLTAADTSPNPEPRDTAEPAVLEGTRILPDGYPKELVYPDAILESAANEPGAVGVARRFVVWSSPDAPETILAYYRRAFHRIGVTDPGVAPVIDDPGVSVLAFARTDSTVGVVVQIGTGLGGTNQITVISRMEPSG